MRRISPEELKKAAQSLGEAALDPAMWPEVLEKFSAAAGATAALLLQNDARTPDVPMTASFVEPARRYFGEGWHRRDTRALRGVPRVLRGEVVTDPDLFAPDELRRDPYFNECVYASGLKWFAAIGFRAGAASWVLSLHRTERDGMFEPADKKILATLSQPLTEAANLSTAVGRSRIAGMTDALNLVRQPAVILDRMGFVLDRNAAADELFDDDLRVSNRRLTVRCREGRAAIDMLLDRLGATPDDASLPTAPIIVQRRGKRPVLIRVLPIGGAARGPFLGARALLVFSDLEPKAAPDPQLLSSLFGLTPAEARLASLIAAGSTPDAAALHLKISSKTARNQLLAVFAKTETHRQSELAALLAPLCRLLLMLFCLVPGDIADSLVPLCCPI